MAPAATNDLNCWTTGLSYDYCCQPEKGLSPKEKGNAICWDAMFTYQRCCHTFAMSDEDEYMLTLSKKNASLEDEGFSSEQIMEEEYACATELFQQYKYEVNVWYNRNSTHWTFLQTNSYIINKFHHVFRVCAPAAITSILIKLESIYFREPRIFD